MTPNSLVCELENATCDLLAAAGTDLDRVQKLLECRAAVLARIAKCAPNTFTPQDLVNLRSAVRNGEAALEKLTLMRRSTAADWNRLKNLRLTIRQPANHSVSFSG
jgi:DNA-binding FadR family transcriptional regulator